VTERRHWDDYQAAFSEMLSATSTKSAPWYVIPADRKWFARICVSAVLAHTLMQIDPRYPVVGDEARERLRAARVELEAEAGTGDRAARGDGHGRDSDHRSDAAGGRRGARTARKAAVPAG
jgi:hypothetical protein